MRKEKGITLIALVITIIILLILAGITISTLTGENGLFARARQSRQNTLDAQEQENIALGNYNNIIDEVLSDEEVKKDYKIILDANNGSGQKKVIQVKYDEEIQLPENEYQLSNTTFGYWATNKTGSLGTYYADKAKVKNLSDAGESIILYARYRHTCSEENNCYQTTELDQTMEYYSHGNIAKPVYGTVYSDEACTQLVSSNYLLGAIDIYEYPIKIYDASDDAMYYYKGEYSERAPSDTYLINYKCGVCGTIIGKNSNDDVTYHKCRRKICPYKIVDISGNGQFVNNDF